MGSALERPEDTVDYELNNQQLLHRSQLHRAQSTHRKYDTQ